MKKYEYPILSLIILVAIFSIGWQIRYFALNPEIYNQSDFNMLRQSGIGKFDTETISGDGWIYKDYLGTIYRPLSWFNETTAFLLYSGISTICFLILSHLVMTREYGWILVLAVLPLFKQTLQNSNGLLIFALLLCFPLSGLLVILFKPHLCVIPLFISIKGYIKSNRCGTDSKITEPNINPSDILCNRRY